MANTDSLTAIAFDLDGTLVDSAPDLALSINLMLSELGRQTHAEDVICGWVGNGAEVLIKRALSGSKDIAEDIEPTLYSHARELFEKHYRDNICVNSRLYPRVLEVLTQLSIRQVPLALVTNKPLMFTKPLLEALGIGEFFSVVLGGDCLARKKPDPLPLQHVLQQWALKPGQLIMVGDSKNDILAARAANCKSFGVTYGYNYGEPITASQPDWVGDDIQPLLTFFKQ